MSSNVTIKKIELLSHDKFPLRKITFDRLSNNGEWQTQHREVYDRGNAATILLYNVQKKNVILTRQFRLPTYLNGNPTGLLIEACAGKLEGDKPEDCIMRETMEETGYTAENVKKVFEAYTSAGGLTELLYCYIGTYSEEGKISEGGGLKEEHEEIEVLEIGFNEALSMIDNGDIKDAKTIMLLQYAEIHHLFN